MPSYGFGLTTPRHMLEKAQHELAQLRTAIAQRASHVDDRLVAYAAINTAWTIWHITDWVFESNDPRSRNLVTAVGGPKLEDFQAGIRKHTDLATCWELATGAKHFAIKRSRKFAQELETTVSIGAVYVLAGVPHQDAHPKVTVQARPTPPSGSSERVLQIFTRALEHWTELFAQHGL